MAKKQEILKETAAAASPARAAKPRTPRVKVAQHSKAVSTETPAAAVQASASNAPASGEETIATIAYGYWESRGCQGGSAIEDWIRAEKEYQLRAAAAGR